MIINSKEMLESLLLVIKLKYIKHNAKVRYDIDIM